MADDEVITILREIRDSQNAYIELYKDAMTNQQSSIDLLKQHIRRQKYSTYFVFAFVLLFIAALLFAACQ